MENLENFHQHWAIVIWNQNFRLRRAIVICGKMLWIIKLILEAYSDVELWKIFACGELLDQIVFLNLRSQTLSLGETLNITKLILEAYSNAKPWKFSPVLGYCYLESKFSPAAGYCDLWSNAMIYQIDLRGIFSCGTLENFRLRQAVDRWAVIDQYVIGM